MTTRRLALAVAGAVVAAALPPSASAGWRQPVGGASPINHANNQGADPPSLAAVGGVPYVAWSEFGGTAFEVRVSRLNAAGTAWQQVVGGASPINHVDNHGAGDPSLAAIGGVPYVAWSEYDGTNSEVRVSRLNATGTAWEQVVGGASPINHAANRSASEPSLAAIGGVPYVAWSEYDGTNFELRVSRLNAAGTAWEQVVGGASPINHADNRNAIAPSLAAIGGVPYVAWSELDGTNDELRVSRLNAAGTAWEQVVGGASPINDADNRNASDASLAAIGGVPYVASTEDDGANPELRVSRLEPEFTSQSVVASATEATLRVGVRTYGIPFPIGFEYGPALASETAAEPAPAGGHDVAVTRHVGGLSPSTGYSFRPFALAGVPAPKVFGTIDAFTTLAATGGAATRLAFGTKTLVTLELAARRIAANGPVAVRISNANGFQVTGKLSGRTIPKTAVSRRRAIKLKTKSFRVGAHARKTVKLTLTNALRRRFRHKRALSLRLTARVTDPAGHTRAVHKRINPRLKNSRKRAN